MEFEDALDRALAALLPAQLHYGHVATSSD
jgi:hypothetical protein